MNKSNTIRLPLHELLPRKMKVMRRCDGMTNNGDRCKSMAAIETYLFLDNEIYDRDCVSWVRACLCEKCCPQKDREKVNVKESK